MESSILHGQFPYHTILGCEVTYLKYVSVYGRGNRFMMCIDHSYKAMMTDPREDGYSVSSLSESHGSVKLIL